MDKRQIKLGVGAFLIVLFATMLGLKPYLPRAFYHNIPTIYDYHFFANREIKTRGVGQPWKMAPQKMNDPDADTQILLRDLKTTALLVIENGQIVYEKYDFGGGAQVISSSFSMSKSIIAILYGFALEDGRIKSLDEPVSHYLPEWEGRDEGKITIRNLLMMSSGLNWQESYYNPFAVTAESYYGSDLYVTALRQYLVDEPGKFFRYQSGNAQLLALILSRAVNQNLSAYLSQKLWQPLGAEHSALWSLDHEDGMEKGFCCINATARDFARIGEFVRLGGVWGQQNLLNANYLEQMLKPTNLPAKDKEDPDLYGYQWWTLSTPQGNIPFAWGLFGQYIVVVPQKNRVVVRLGMDSGKLKDHYPPELRALVNFALSR